MRHDHKQYYVGDDEAVAEIITTAVGPRGPNLDYFTSTQAHLYELNMRDPAMDRLAAAIEKRLG